MINNILIATEHELPDNPPLQKVKKIPKNKIETHVFNMPYRYKTSFLTWTSLYTVYFYQPLLLLTKI